MFNKYCLKEYCSSSIFFKSALKCSGLRGFFLNDDMCIPFYGYKLQYTDLSLGIIYKPIKKKHLKVESLFHEIVLLTVCFNRMRNNLIFIRVSGNLKKCLVLYSVN